MKLIPTICYRAVLARDERHDGRFFICVKTTGIYCRPICPARPPKLENCVFVSSAAAQEAGFRPCLRCRPESSPELSAWRGTSATVSRGLRLIDEGALDENDVEALAGRLGVGARHLRRLFREHLGAAPITVAQTRRVLLAKQLLHETELTMTEVALASGFGSVRRFNETFQQLYDRPPAELRRKRIANNEQASDISLLLSYQEPYDWPSMIEFLAARALPGVECIRDDSYIRTIEIDGAMGLRRVANEPEQSALRLYFSREERRRTRRLSVRMIRGRFSKYALLLASCVVGVRNLGEPLLRSFFMSCCHLLQAVALLMKRGYGRPRAGGT